MSDIVQGFRQALQDIVAPEIRELRGDVKALNARVDALGDKVDVLGDKFEEKYNALRSEFVSVKTEVASGFHSLQLALDNAVLRGEKENWREIADLRERMTRLEDHVRGTPPQ